MAKVNFYRTYHLNHVYEHVKAQSDEILGKYLEYPDLYEFNDEQKCLSFKSERLIPTKYSNRPRVMLLFSNPHPHSVHQGMLLSPNTKGRENPFWETMRNAAWINFRENPLNPLQIANLCFSVAYGGPFDFIFYPYYAFPTNYPNEIKQIFGQEYFNQIIELEADTEFKRTIQETDIKAIVTFNKDIFNTVSEITINKYIDRLISGELVVSRVKGFEKEIPIFLTFPTGWRYHKDIISLKKRSLELIKSTINCNFGI